MCNVTRTNKSSTGNRAGKMSDKYRKISRMVIEEHLGRELSIFEIIHHIDGDRSNNEIENLQIMTREEHTSLHCAGRRKRKNEEV